MSAPIPGDIGFYPGSETAPTNDTDSIGGDIDTDAELVQTDPGVIINVVNSSEAPQTIFGIFYIKNNADGSVQNARIYNRAQAIPAATGGPVQVISSSGADTTIKLRVTSYIGSSLAVPETVNLNGLTPVVTINSYDNDADAMYEILDVSSAPVNPQGNITISIGGQIVAVIYGIIEQNATSIPSTKMATTIMATAVATAKNSSISSENRTILPLDISDPVHNSNWAGNDQSISIPDNVLLGGEIIAVVQVLSLPISWPTAVVGYYEYAPILIGNSTS